MSALIQKASFTVPQHLLWEYDLSSFDYVRNARLVIERVIQRGNIREWRNTQLFYGKEKMLEVAKHSQLLTDREKAFTSLYVNSTLNDPHRTGDHQAGHPTATR